MDELRDFWVPRECFVPRFPELENACDLIDGAADALLAGDMEGVKNLLHQANDPKLRDLATKTMGLMDQETHRFRSAKTTVVKEKVARRMPVKAVTDQVFARDGWRCRFCGVRVIVPGARKVLANAAPEALCWQGTNADMHAAFLYVSATLDHLVPHSRGGTNEPDNLVTACWPCQFGRGGYLIEEMGISDPRDRAPVQDDWDGLTRLLKQRHPTQKPKTDVATKQKSNAVPSRPTSQISAVEWLSQIGDASAAADTIRAIMDICEGLPIIWTARDVLMLKMTVGERTLYVFGFERTGDVQIPWWIGDAKAALKPFALRVASAIPLSTGYETPKLWTVRHADRRPLRIVELNPGIRAIKEALERLAVDLAAMPALA